MCGIVGGYDRNTNWQTILPKMTNALAHRGPDADGHWIEEGIALGHRRLAIIDLSENGAQPMISPSGRYMMVYNGETYNYLSLRQALAPHTTFRSGSDTEVILAGFDQWGIETTIKKMVGMFAIVVWDKKKHQLTLSRDRMGEKPLYYGWLGSSFVFGSELKPFKSHPNWQGTLNREALAAFLRLNYVPTPYSIYEQIAKLPPATILTLTEDDLNRHQSPDPVPYWSVADALNQPPETRPDDVLIDELDTLLRDVVLGQMVSDVPLGAFLSGGIDSSLIVALMQAQNTTPVRTFSIGFEQADFDEAPHAKAVAEHLGTHHTEHYVSPSDLLDVIPKLPRIYDEPFSDSSQIPTYLVSQITRQAVTVSLSGDGGDELFAGYTRYYDAARAYNQFGKLPTPVQRLTKGILGLRNTRQWRGIFNTVRPVLPAFLREHDTADKLHRLEQMLPIRSRDSFYQNVMSHWLNPESVVLGNPQPRLKTPQLNPADHIVHQMSHHDMVTYLPDDILAKVDRAAMAVSLETRVPFLDHRVVEFAARVPFSYKKRGPHPKWLLRQVLYRYVPSDLIDRPKMGFGVPLAGWLRHDLVDWADDLLSPSRLRNEGIFDPDIITTRWQQHRSGDYNWHYHLWDVLMFQAWYQHEY